MDRLQKLAQQMAQAQQAVQKGDGKKAADAMNKWRSSSLNAKRHGPDEAARCHDGPNGIGQGRNGLQNCNGKGCEECQGNMLGMNNANNPFNRTESLAAE